MDNKYIATNPNIRISKYITNEIFYWLKSIYNLFKRISDRLNKSIVNFSNFSSLFYRQSSNYQELGLGQDYSFLIIDRENNKAYIGGRDRPLKIDELVMLPNASNYEIYQVEDICLLSSNMWVASANKVIN